MAGLSESIRRVRAAGWLLVGFVLLLPGLSRARAADAEVRDFDIQVDGKHAGDYHMTIRNQGDGTVTLDAQSEVKVTILLVPVYTYSYHGTEVWKDGRLQHFESTGKENGKSFGIIANPGGAGLRILANGRVYTTRPEVWTSSCWQLPEAKFRNQAVPMMGCDTGQPINGSLQFVGTDRITVAGQEQSCTHYQVKRPTPYELWYDSQERLVREEWVSDGHRTVLEMTALHR